MEYFGILCVTVSCVNLEFALDLKHGMNGFIKPICLPLEETMVGKMSEVILNVSSWRFTKLQVIAIVKAATTKNQLNQFSQELNYTFHVII